MDWLTFENGQGHRVRVILDSRAPSNCRLTTLEVTLPRMVLAELNTHRMFSRNSASSRAIPVERQIQRVLDDPFVPDYWGANQKGMQAEQQIDDEAQERARRIWLSARDHAVYHARAFLELGVHKQLANRLLEPFMWHTVLITATEWSNFIGLRCHPAAQPEIREAAELVEQALAVSEPQELACGEWHMPFILDEDVHEAMRVPEYSMDYDVDKHLRQVSIARCARVSYLTHDGRRDHQADLDLHDRLLQNRHMSPFEHVAWPANNNGFYANFRGWIQARNYVPYESDALAWQRSQKAEVPVS